MRGFYLTLCLNPVELCKRMFMSFINMKGPAPPLISNRLYHSASMGPIIVSRNTATRESVIFSLDHGKSPEPWEPNPAYDSKGNMIATAEEVGQSVKRMLECFKGSHKASWPN